MPLHLPPLTRRAFVASLGAAAVTLPSLRSAGAEVDDDLVALLNDTHIGEKQKPDAPIPRNLKTTVDALVALPKRPAMILINGDMAMRDGQPGDYRYFANLIRPLREAGMPVHVTLGNHDDRAVFYDVLREEKPKHPVVASRHVAVVPARRANFFLLDSLLKTMIAEGDLGAEQLRWLAQALDAHTDKPAIIIAHHNPRFGDPAHIKGGLVDTQALWEIIGPRKHVKAYVHGHIHHWNVSGEAGIHIINTPATSYVANPQLSTTGWTLARLAASGMTVTTYTHLESHEWNNKSHQLNWRS